MARVLTARLGRLLRTLPIGAQVVFGGLAASVLLWFVLDHFQTQQLNEVFKEDAAQRLDEQSARERLKFGHSVRTHQGYIRMIVGQADMARRLRDGFQSEGGVAVKDAPPWLPSRSVRRLFVEPDAFLVFDDEARLRAIYRLRDVILPGPLAAADQRLLGQSEKEPLLHAFESGMFLISAASIVGDDGRKVTLVGATRLDGRFLRDAQGAMLNDGTITALVSGGDRVVFASSQPDRVPPWTHVNDLQDQYLVVGKGFFDYGFSEVWAGFVILVERSRVERLIRPIVSLERSNRTMVALAIGVLFTLVLLYVTFRIERLSDRVAAFTAQAFGIAPDGARSGDELVDLDAKVERLTHEVLASRAALEAETRDKLAIMASTNQALEQKVDQRTAELRQALVEAQTATEAKSRFLAAASHDLRQPLQAVRLYEALLRDRLGDDDGLQVVLDHLGRSVGTAEGLLNALLDMSKIEAGVIIPAPSRFSLSTLLEEVRRDFTMIADDGGCHLMVMDSGAVVEADFSLLGRIVKNLVSNAIKHGGGGRVLVGARRDGRAVRLEVWDEGPGIPPQDLSLIFEEFYQLTNPERDREKGLGLGLAIARKLSDLCGFSLDVRSAVGKGSVFSVAIPQVWERAEAAAELCEAPA